MSGKKHLKFAGRVKLYPGDNGVKTAAVGKGRFLMADDIMPLLDAAGINRERMTDNGLQFVRRTYKNGNSYFIANE
jgi:hypothetical protein